MSTKTPAAIWHDTVNGSLEAAMKARDALYVAWPELALALDATPATADQGTILPWRVRVAGSTDAAFSSDTEALEHLRTVIGRLMASSDAAAAAAELVFSLEVI